LLAGGDLGTLLVRSIALRDHSRTLADPYSILDDRWRLYYEHLMAT